jgi:hypothetical protein
MATTTTVGTDLAQMIAGALEGIGGLRVYWYVSDAVRPPAVVVAQPSVDYTDTLGGFCHATWTYPLTLVVTRNNDRQAQLDMAAYLQQVTSTLAAITGPDVYAVEPVEARPTTVTVSGQELPGYAITVRVRA